MEAKGEWWLLWAQGEWDVELSNGDYKRFVLIKGFGNSDEHIMNVF